MKQQKLKVETYKSGRVKVHLNITDFATNVHIKNYLKFFK